MKNEFTDTTPSLPPLLEEFRAALQDEIEAAKRNSSSSAVPLSNGHKVASLGSAHQYAFLIDSVLNMPDGAPGDLVVPEKSPVAATIVSAEGLRIVISIEVDLGKFVPTARLQTNLTILMRKLIERIENNANQENPAAQRMLGYASVSGIPQKKYLESILNQHQLAALESALGRNLTVIWGPPGTGKTHIIGTITEQLNKSSRTVLLVSHTNTAVDQAIKHVATAMKDLLALGAVIRVGVVKDNVLSTDFPEVLLKSQVERQSQNLMIEREHLFSLKQKLADDVASTQESLEIVEWLDTSKKEITSIEAVISSRDWYREHERNILIELNSLRRQHPHLLQLHEYATKAYQLKNLLDDKQEESITLQNQFKMLSDERQRLTSRVSDQESRIKIAHRIDPIRNERAGLPSQSEQNNTIASISEKLREANEKLDAAQKDLKTAKALLDQSLNNGALSRLLKRLPKPEDQRAIVDLSARMVTALEIETTATHKAHNAAIEKLAKIIELDGELARYASINLYSQELDEKMQSEKMLELIASKTIDLDSVWSKLKKDIRQYEKEFSEIAGKIGGDVKTVYWDVCGKIQKLKELQDSEFQAKQMASQMQSRADNLLSKLISAINQWVDFKDKPTSFDKCFAIFLARRSRLAEAYATTELKYLNDTISKLRTEIRSIDSKISEIDTKLTAVEREVINKAAVLGATLTKTYLSDDIQSRKFDTVIIDEASMAPIPALWAAALLAENNLIIVGDFKQLPPIVLSNNDLTKKWLGRDIFEASGIKDKWVKDETPPYFIALREQRRMLPEIARVANEFYDKQLVNAFTAPDQYRDYESFKAWYTKGWKFDNPVMLVDTGPLNAWVTSVVKHGNSSRLNFLSATVAVDIAEQLLSPDRPKGMEGAHKRILIISPYRAHAKLLKVLLEDFADIQDEVVAGTAHSFQGSEADVVIFDTVVDEPQWRVNLFWQKIDDQMIRLLNVALTRAKFRLIILGDFDYCMKQGKKAFLGKTLIPFLLGRFPRFDARKIVPEGLAARAAKVQMSIMGGRIDSNCERIVVTQVDFYRLLSNDLAVANRRVIIYSPFATTDRVSFLLPQLQAAIERGVEVYIITKALSERPKSDLLNIKKIEKQLTQIGIAVIHKLRMHEKLVFIDEEITWSGSLNPLSFSNTQEIMERRKSKTVLKDYFEILRLNELLAAHGKPEGQCPICGEEIIAAEGADQPYYWRCINDDCFTRGVDQPYPFDGVLTCGNCNSTVEYGYWGDYPHWRCTSNKMHRLKIFKSHLRLPKMAALVPLCERKKLCELLKIEDFDNFAWGADPDGNMGSKQMNLFE